MKVYLKQGFAKLANCVNRDRHEWRFKNVMLQVSDEGFLLAATDALQMQMYRYSYEDGEFRPEYPDASELRGECKYYSIKPKVFREICKQSCKGRIWDIDGNKLTSEGLEYEINCERSMPKFSKILAGQEFYTHHKDDWDFKSYRLRKLTVDNIVAILKDYKRELEKYGIVLMPGDSRVYIVKFDYDDSTVIASTRRVGWADEGLEPIIIPAKNFLTMLQGANSREIWITPFMGEVSDKFFMDSGLFGNHELLSVGMTRTMHASDKTKMLDKCVQYNDQILCETINGVVIHKNQLYLRVIAPELIRNIVWDELSEIDGITIDSDGYFRVDSDKEPQLLYILGDD